MASVDYETRKVMYLLHRSVYTRRTPGSGVGLSNCVCNTAVICLLYDYLRFICEKQ